MTRPPKKRKPVALHIHGNAVHNFTIQAAIGGLIVGWSNNESVFMAMLQALVTGDELTASIIWTSQKTSRPRLDLVSRLVREQVKDTTLIADIENAINRFSGLSRARNFYCHATYNHAVTDGAILSAHGMALSAEGEPLTFEDKQFDSATLNEINDITMKLALLNRELWALVVRLQAALGVQRVRLPQWPDGEQQPPDSHPPKSTVALPQSPPESLEE